MRFPRCSEARCVGPQAYGTPAFPLPCLGGTRPREEVRDGPHNNNRCGGNRCGITPTAAPLRSEAGFYNALGRAFFSFPFRAAFALPHPKHLRTPPNRGYGPLSMRIQRPVADMFSLSFQVVGKHVSTSSSERASEKRGDSRRYERCYGNRNQRCLG